jgi:N utilization substance protein B
MTGFPGEDHRSEARERALGLLYEAETKSQSVAETLGSLPVAPDQLAIDLVNGVEAQRDRIDEILGRHARGWTVARMAMLDRGVLRIATFELLERPAVPTAVILDEAVELAKSYGSTDESGRFVNGILAAVARELRS